MDTNFLLLKQLQKKIEKRCKRFLWNGDTQAKKKVLIACKYLVLAKSSGRTKLFPRHNYQNKSQHTLLAQCKQACSQKNEKMTISTSVHNPYRHNHDTSSIMNQQFFKSPTTHHISLYHQVAFYFPIFIVRIVQHKYVTTNIFTTFDYYRTYNVRDTRFYILNKG